MNCLSLSLPSSSCNRKKARYMNNTQQTYNYHTSALKHLSLNILSKSRLDPPCKLNEKTIASLTRAISCVLQQNFCPRRGSIYSLATIIRIYRFNEQQESHPHIPEIRPTNLHKGCRNSVLTLPAGSYTEIAGWQENQHMDPRGGGCTRPTAKVCTDT
jgi:hypothetical protein